MDCFLSLRGYITTNGAKIIILWSVHSIQGRLGELWVNANCNVKNVKNSLNIKLRHDETLQVVI